MFVILRSDPSGDLKDDLVIETADGTRRPSEDRLRTGQYPPGCTRRVAPPDGTGLVATTFNRAVEIGNTSTVTDTFRKSGPVSWSPGGGFLAVGGTHIYSAETGQLRDFGPRLLQWAWSPIADCLVGATNNGELVVVRPTGRPLLLITGDRVARFDFAPNGRSMLVRSGGRSSVLDLVDVRLLKKTASRKGFETTSTCPTFSKIASESCSTDGRYVVGIQNDRLVLVGENGTRPLAFGSYEERFPEWGPPRTGVLFLRRPNGEDRVEVWFIPEGGTARETPFSFPSAEVWDRTNYPWASVMDWNVSPPRVRCGPGKCLRY